MVDTRITRQAIEFAGKKYLRPVVEPESLPEDLEVFFHNWEADFEVKNAWSTDVTTALTVAEERRGLVDKPYRQIRVQFTGLDQGTAARVWALFMRAHHQRLVVPIYSDRVTTSATVLAGATAIGTSEDCTLRRFFPGMVAVIFTPGWPEPLDIEFVKIDSFGPSLTLSEPTAIDHPGGSIVTPIAFVEPRLQSSGTLPSGRTADVSLEFDEVAGPSGMPAWTAPGDYPVLDTYRQFPILPTSWVNWSKVVSATAQRSGNRHRRGRATVTDLSGDRPRAGYELTMTGMTRAESVDRLRFLDSRRGRVAPFWVISPQEMWSVVSLSATALRVRFPGTKTDLDRFVRHVAIGFSDGTNIIRRIGGVAPVAGEPDQYDISFGLTFESGLTAVEDAKTPIFATAAHLCRLKTDDYREKWMTDHHVEVDLKAIEVHEERPVSVQRLDGYIPFREQFSTLQVTNLFTELFMYLEAPSNLFPPLLVNGGSVSEWNDWRAGFPAGLESSPLYVEDAHELFDQWIRASNYGSATPASVAEFRAKQDDPIWNNATGMTLFIAMQRHEGPTYDQSTDYILSFVGQSPIHWTRTGLQLAEDLGVVDPEFQVSTGDLFGVSGFVVLCLTWKPGQYCRIYRDGILMGQTPSAPVDLPTPADPRVRMLRMANDSGDVASNDDTMFKSVAVLHRALNPDELNIFGLHLANLVGSTWSRVVT